MLKRVHIVGRKNQGKTTLVVDLVQEFSRLGIRVGTIKHTHHDHELDTPGKDSYRHRAAGASVVGIWTRTTNAVFWDSETTDPDKVTDPDGSTERDGATERDGVTERDGAAERDGSTERDGATDPNQTTAESEEARYAAFEPMLERCDLLLVEGHLRTPAPKVEVWQASCEQRPLCETVPSIVAVVTDDELSTETPVWPRADIQTLAKNILALQGHHGHQ